MIGTNEGEEERSTPLQKNSVQRLKMHACDNR